MGMEIQDGRKQLMEEAKNFVNTKVGGRPLRYFMRGTVGHGEDVAFWLDTWLLDEPLKTAFPDLISKEADKRVSVADRFISQSSDGRYSWSWNSDLSDSILRSRLEQLIGLLDSVILATGKARWKWTSALDGSFSVKAVKKLLNGDQVQEKCFVLDWCNWIPAKVNIHVWRLEMNKVLTAEALRKRNVGIRDTTCPLCHSEDESADHLFIGCFIASTVWSGVSSWCNIPNIFALSIRDLLSFYKDLGLSEKKRDAVQGIIMITCWSVWRARNNVKFSNSSVRIESIISEIKTLSFLWFSNRSRYKGLDWKD
ncbi:uncharacterized protein LOC110943890 [Helianthus annuus]|uniref:uncharacterized protein LOC110943890 n=1 Tax=Helianthus annuus TaxID=4232 RepID=UPI000B90719E|nr:uncharacterized protein LOC110943890 [Helianthus annuus]